MTLETVSILACFGHKIRPSDNQVIFLLSCYPTENKALTIKQCFVGKADTQRGLYIKDMMLSVLIQKFIDIQKQAKSTQQFFVLILQSTKEVIVTKRAMCYLRF